MLKLKITILKLIIHIFITLEGFYFKKQLWHQLKVSVFFIIHLKLKFTLTNKIQEIFRSNIDGNNNNNIHSNNNGENFIEIDDESAIIDDLICDGKRITVYYNTITGNLTWKEIGILIFILIINN